MGAEQGQDTSVVTLCSPELNPQEYADQDLKTNITRKKRAANREQLRKNITDFMEKRKVDKP